MTRWKLRRAPAVLTLALGILLANTAEAGRERWPRNFEASPRGPYLTADQRRITLEQAVAIVQRATGGRVLDAKETGGHYRIKVLTRDGEVRILYVDASTGSMR